MNAQEPGDDFPIELLAAYVDGELGAAARHRVECWLKQNPHALETLLDQQDLCPANLEMWQVVAPPEVSSQNWDHTFQQIEQGLTPPTRRRSRSWHLIPAMTLASIAASLMIALLTLERERPKEIVRIPPAIEQPHVTEEDGDETIFRVATAEDVEIIQLPEEAVPLLVVGKHPMADVPLVLASGVDVQVLNYGLDDQGQVADFQIMKGPDTPMFVAPPRKSGTKPGNTP